MRKPSNIATGVAGLVIGLGVAAGGTAYAATSSTPSTTASPSASTGSSSATHSSRLRSRLDALVRAGTITQAQESSILAKVGPGGAAGRTWSGGRAHGRRPQNGQRQLLAKALGMTTTQLRADVAKGMTLQQIATSKGMSEQQLVTALDKQADARVSSMVSKAWTTKLPVPHAGGRAGSRASSSTHAG